MADLTLPVKCAIHLQVNQCQFSFQEKQINADNLTPATLTSPSDATYVSSQARRLSETQYVFFSVLHLTTKHNE